CCSFPSFVVVLMVCWDGWHAFRGGRNASCFVLRAREPWAAFAEAWAFDHCVRRIGDIVSLTSAFDVIVFANEWKVVPETAVFLGPTIPSNLHLVNAFDLVLMNGMDPISGYHSSFVDEEGVSKACGCPLLPLKSHINEPDSDAEQEDATSDIVDEAITFFRANIFFKNFDYKSSADKLLIYLTLYINLALKRLEGSRTLAEGKKSIINLGLEKIVIPGEAGFPFPGLFASPKSQQDAGKLCFATLLSSN
ncbi:hypothetical protein MTR67_007410, partial [Solanum verrucosum]